MLFFAAFCYGGFTLRVHLHIEASVLRVGCRRVDDSHPEMAPRGVSKRARTPLYALTVATVAAGLSAIFVPVILPVAAVESRVARMCLRPIRVCACDISCALEVCIVAMPKRQHLHTDSHTT